MTIFGLILAVWATTGAMTAFMRALNRAYEREETRSFIKKRLSLSRWSSACWSLSHSSWAARARPLHLWMDRQRRRSRRPITVLWWVLQWPVLIVGLLAAFAAVLYLGPNVDHPRWQFLTPGALVAVTLWLLTSGLFALYTAFFASYNKTWGSLATVIVMLTWLWLSAIALLVGAELNAEAERSRELRQGKPAETHIQAPEQG